MEYRVFSYEELSNIYNTLSFEDLKYWNMPSSCYIDDTSRLSYILCLGDIVDVKVTYMNANWEDVEDIEQRRQVVGMMMLTRDHIKKKKIVHMNAISVHPDFEGKGIAKQLFQCLIKHQKELLNECILQRTKPSIFAPKFFAGIVDKWLAGSGVRWTQERNVDGRDMVVSN